jgi:hypothetical protein
MRAAVPLLACGAPDTRVANHNVPKAPFRRDLITSWRIKSRQIATSGAV